MKLDFSQSSASTPEMMSYARILRDRQDFRRSGSRSGSDFNIFDTPSQKYFKILFYFNGKSEFETDDSRASGLLAPTWQYIKKVPRDKIPSNPVVPDLSEAFKTFGYQKKTTPEQPTEPVDNEYYDYHNYNSAWAYLKMNDENERAEKLQQFITLLSNINSESPWYFSSVSGLDSAQERKVATDGKLDMNEVKRLQIKCLPDAVDDRIGTLLSLYRDITWSWTMKKEILPVNMRKFDMAIYVFEAPMSYIHEETDIIDGKSGFKPSYKMFEFHNCEFDYNSLKSGYSELSNQTGTQPTYTIDIMYDDCYEVSYNNIMMRTIGDIIKTDTSYTCMLNGDPVYSIVSEEQVDDIDISEELKSRITHNTGAVKQLIGAVKGDVKSLIKRAILGNIYTYSLTKIGSDIDSALQGNLIKAGQTAKQYIKNAQQRAAMKNYRKQPPKATNIYSGDVPQRGIPSGNIFNKTTIANNT